MKAMLLWGKERNRQELKSSYQEVESAHIPCEDIGITYIFPLLEWGFHWLLTLEIRPGKQLLLSSFVLISI